MDFGDAWSLDEARSHAGQIDRRIRIGENLWEAAPAFWREYCDPLLRGKLGIPEPAKALRMTTADVVEGRPLARDAAFPLWLAEVKRTRKPATVQSYRNDITHPALRKYGAWHVNAFTRQHAAEVVAEIAPGRDCRVRHPAVFRIPRLRRDDRKTGVEGRQRTALKSPERTMLTYDALAKRANGDGGHGH